MTAFVLLLAVLGPTNAVEAAHDGGTLLVDGDDTSCSDVSGSPFCTIQAAVDHAAADDTVRVASGDYDEGEQEGGSGLFVDTPGLTLLGPNAGIPGWSDDRSPESTIQTRVNITADGVTFDGFEIGTPGGCTVMNVHDVANTEVVNNRWINGGDTAIDLHNATTTVIEANQIECTSPLWSTGAVDTTFHFNDFISVASGGGLAGVLVFLGGTRVGTPIDARFNWWGDESGPSGEGPGSGVNVTSMVIFSPFCSVPNPDCVPVHTFTDDDDSVFENAIEWLAAEGITEGCNPPFNDEFCPGDPVTRGQMAAFIARAFGYSDTGTGNYFTDTAGSVFQNAIDRIRVAGITEGCNPPDNDEYCPDRFVTRGQMAAFLVRAFGFTDSGSEDYFTDTADSVFKTAIDRLREAGVTEGCNPPDNDSYCPDDQVTRGQLAAFLKRGFGE